MSFLRAAASWRRAAILLALSCVTACSPQDAMMKITDPEDRAFALEAVERLQACDAVYLTEITTPPLRGKVGPIIPTMCAVVPKGADAKARLIDATSMAKLGPAGFRRTEFTYEVDEGQAHALIRVGVTRSGSTVVLSDLYVGSLGKPIEGTTAFSLVGKSPVQYLFLLIAAAMVALSVTAVVLVIATKGLRLKWLWVIGCLVGFGQLSVDWTSGMIYGQFITMQLLSASVMKLGMGPWRVGFAIPVFAILFLIRRRDLQRAAPPRKPQLNL